MSNHRDSVSAKAVKSRSPLGCGLLALAGAGFVCGLVALLDVAIRPVLCHDGDPICDTTILNIAVYSP
ncbi:hypothetical protein HUW46_09077 [Amycolatopsis sp. CA-230715]|nr:hypothetical protein HUW46_09077 [Amycolatopsis sp. CA-230715]